MTDFDEVYDKAVDAAEGYRVYALTEQELSDIVSELERLAALQSVTEAEADLFDQLYTTLFHCEKQAAFRAEGIASARLRDLTEEIVRDFAE